MKKNMLLGTLLFLTCHAMAQVDTVNTYRPSKNNFSVEVNFTPFNGATLITVDGFRGRLFLSDKLAIRLGATFGMKKAKNETPVQYNGSTYYQKRDEHSTTLGIIPGVEYHFLRTKRFSPYAGLVIGYENKTSKATYDNPIYSGGSNPSIYISTTESKNAWLNSYSSSGYYLTEVGYSRLACNLLLGADVYIIKHLYLGFEFGLGYDAYFYKEVEISIEGVPQPGYPKSSYSTIGFNAENAIRLGYWF